MIRKYVPGRGALLCQRPVSHYGLLLEPSPGPCDDDFGFPGAAAPGPGEILCLPEHWEKPHNRENEPTTWCAGEGYPPTCAVRPKIRTALSAVRGHAVVGLWFEGVSFVVRSGFGRNSLRGISESRMFLHFVIFKTILRKL